MKEQKNIETPARHIKRWAPVGILAVIFACIYIFELHKYFTLNSIQMHQQALADFTHDNFIFSALSFFLLYALTVTLSLPFATILTLLGGFLFGSIWGTALVVSGATVGATLVFMIARSSAGAFLRERAGGLYNKINDKMKNGATSYLLFLRLVPLFPFFLVNIVPALFNIPLRTYVWTTCVGIIPGSFVYVNLGGSLAEITSLNDLASPKTLIAFVLLGLFAFIPKIYQTLKGTNS